MFALKDKIGLENEECRKGSVPKMNSGKGQTLKERSEGSDPKINQFANGRVLRV
jgi:hypothetical protein